MDWHIFATIAAPVVALFVGALLDRKLERRPRLISFLSHATAVRVNPPDGQPFNINSHSIVVRNAGRLAATNLRLGHNHLPADFSIWPPSEHVVNRRDDGTAEIVFPTLVPGEQVVITYLYPSPTTFSQINTYTKSDSGFAQIVTALTAPMQSPAVKGALTGLATYGAIMLLYNLWHGIVWIRGLTVGS
ncbi:hypothetical protein H0E84_19935 [Luteimonas sp. SJ-92]|uniref:Uncharacterized protein n=1 Tax=Luteimonas salinisoli TaxID=2752307 RepID=A0A853JJV0_9GAMM|nr:hypothetical protein [Luteimonas salinisoli]NZA28650.1 hypothetical protein [Luteimonas salinisoli]